MSKADQQWEANSFQRDLEKLPLSQIEDLERAMQTIATNYQKQGLQGSPKDLQLIDLYYMMRDVKERKLFNVTPLPEGEAKPSVKLL